MLKSEKQLPRAPRVQLLHPLHRIRFHMKSPAQVPELLLTNISSSGAGILRSPDITWPPAGSLLQGDIEIEGTRTPASLKIVHLNAKVIGCRFEEPSVQIGILIARYYQVELAALEMNRLRSDYLKAVSVGTPNWIRGENNCEVYFVAEAGRIIDFHLSFFGNYVEGGQGKKTRFGQVVDSDQAAEEDQKPSYKGSSLIQFHPTVSEEWLQMVLRFIHNVPKLEAAERQQLATLLESPAAL